MNPLSFPWLESTILVLLAGAAAVMRQSTVERRAVACLWISAVAFGLTLGAAIDHWTVSAETSQAGLSTRLGPNVLILDALNAPLLLLAALLYLLTFAGTLRTKMRRFSFPAALVSEALLLGAISCRAGWMLVALLVLRIVPPLIELRRRNQPTGALVFHMAAFVALITAGYWLVEHRREPLASGMLVAPLTIAILIYSGIAPFHCWAPDLFQRATFGSALLFLTPMVGAYAAARFLLPVATDATLHWVGVLSLFSALYAAGLAAVQTDARRFFCFLLLSHLALVFVGLTSLSIVSLTGALCVWLSIGLALGGLGLCLRALEARHGRISLVRFQGLYSNTPGLAVCFLLTGLASVGFPFTFGFVGTEMLIDGAAHASIVGIALVLVAAINGIAVVRAYFIIFTGAQHAWNVPLGMGFREQCGVLVLTTLIFVGGLFPQPIVAWRYAAAKQLVAGRISVGNTKTEIRESPGSDSGEADDDDDAVHAISINATMRD